MGKKKRAESEAEAARLKAVRSHQASLRGLASAARLSPEERVERARKAGLAAAAKRRRERAAAGLPEHSTKRSADTPQPSARALEPWLAEVDRRWPDREFTAEARRREAILLLRQHTAAVNLAEAAKRPKK
ncbi:hypothetical protein [Labedella endophytica]|uniref:Uncharacterized protein n=1 Tax=Labedella endophytica TaxID=1523160 RepID=A0A3S0VBC0_9MICO|nr:hypothetical protein [Labedella endophytica]RUR01422.1 hypothetical protein ELQ94_07955 [Labedella endophytica]